MLRRVCNLSRQKLSCEHVNFSLGSHRAIHRCFYRNRWEISVRAESDWRPVVIESVPPGLRGRPRAKVRAEVKAKVKTEAKTKVKAKAKTEAKTAVKVKGYAKTNGKAKGHAKEKP